MNILFLEDSGIGTNYVTNILTELGHSVYDAYNISDAKTYWATIKIDCIITDLNLSPDGLTKKEKLITHYGEISGWVWLNNYVLEKNPHMREKTIIYSGYISSLHKYFSYEDLKGIYLISKKESNNAESLLSAINEISAISNKLTK